MKVLLEKNVNMRMVLDMKNLDIDVIKQAIQSLPENNQVFKSAATQLFIFNALVSKPGGISK